MSCSTYSPGLISRTDNLKTELEERFGAGAHAEGKVDANTAAAKMFSRAAVELLDTIMQLYQQRTDGESGWDKPFEKVVDDLERVVMQLLLSKGPSFPDLKPLVLALEHIKVACTEFGDASRVSKILKRKTYKEAISKAAAELSDAIQNLNDALLLSLHDTPDNIDEIGRVPKLKELYVSRVELENEVSEHLINGSCNCVVLEGTSGMGKTTLAAQLVQKGGCVEAHFKHGTFYLDVGDLGGSKWGRSRLLEEFHRMVSAALPGSAALLGGREVAIQADKDSLVSHLAALLHGKKCLVVLDDIRSHHLEVLELFMASGVQVLATTVECPKLMGVVRKCIQGFNDVKSMELLHMIIGEVNEKSVNVWELLQKNAGRPLALVMCASQIKHLMLHREVVTFEKAAAGLLGEVSDGGRPANVRVEHLMELALKQVSEEEKMLYKMLVVLPSGASAPLDMLQHLWDRSDEGDVQEVIGKFVDLSLLFPNFIGGKVTWRLHSCHQAFIAKDIEKEVLKFSSARQRKYLSKREVFMEFFKEDWIGLLKFWWRVGGLHGMHVFYEKALEAAEVDPVFVASAGYLFHKMGDCNKAVILYKSVSAVVNACSELAGVDLCFFKACLAHALRDNGNLGGACIVLKEELELTKHNLGDDHPSVANCLNRLGVVFHELGGLEVAAKVLQEAVRIQKNGLSRYHLSVAVSLHRLGSVLRELGMIEDAKKVLEEAGTIQRRTLGKDDTSVAGAMQKGDEIMHGDETVPTLHFGNVQPSNQPMERRLSESVDLRVRQNVSAIDGEHGDCIAPWQKVWIEWWKERARIGHQAFMGILEFTAFFLIACKVWGVVVEWELVHVVGLGQFEMALLVPPFQSLVMFSYTTCLSRWTLTLPEWVLVNFIGSVCGCCVYVLVGVKLPCHSFNDWQESLLMSLWWWFWAAVLLIQHLLRLFVAIRYLPLMARIERYLECQKGCVHRRDMDSADGRLLVFTSRDLLWLGRFWLIGPGGYLEAVCICLSRSLCGAHHGQNTVDFAAENMRVKWSGSMDATNTIPIKKDIVDWVCSLDVFQNKINYKTYLGLLQLNRLGKFLDRMDCNFELNRWDLSRLDGILGGIHGQGRVCSYHIGDIVWCISDAFSKSWMRLIFLAILASVGLADDDTHITGSAGFGGLLILAFMISFKNPEFGCYFLAGTLALGLFTRGQFLVLMAMNGVWRLSIRMLQRYRASWCSNVNIASRADVLKNLLNALDAASIGREYDEGLALETIKLIVFVAYGKIGDKSVLKYIGNSARGSSNTPEPSSPRPFKKTSNHSNQGSSDVHMLEELRETVRKQVAEKMVAAAADLGEVDVPKLMKRVPLCYQDAMMNAIYSGMAHKRTGKVTEEWPAEHHSISDAVLFEPVRNRNGSWIYLGSCRDVMNSPCVGTGAHGKVMKVKMGNGKLVAVKLDYCDGPSRKGIENELKAFANIEPHRNIIECFGGNLDPCNPTGHVFIVLDLMDRNLDTLIHDADFMRYCRYSELLQVFLGVAKGLAHLHAYNVYHYDMKPSNVLLDVDMTAKIADFGLCTLEDVSTITLSGKGTQGYMAPEICVANATGKKISGKVSKIDVYSFGAMLKKAICADNLDGIERTMRKSIQGKFMNDCSGSNCTNSTKKQLGTEAVRQVTGAQDMNVPRKHEHKLDFLCEEGWEGRQKLPRHCPRDLRKVVQNCMKLFPKNRPEMKEVAENLEGFLDKNWASELVRGGCQNSVAGE